MSDQQATGGRDGADGVEPGPVVPGDRDDETPRPVDGQEVGQPSDGPIDGPTDPPADGAPPARRRRRDPLAASLIGVLTLLLGFAFAVQVRNSGAGEELEGLREDDLVRILDDLSAREDRLSQEIADQRAALDQLGNSDSAQAAALEEAQQRAEALGILNGTIAAEGPGLQLTIRDPQGKVPASTMLNAVQELRGAGAETMQVDDVRIGVSSAITGRPGELEIDGQPIEAPYTILVIGSPEDMATAMNIPGGVAATVRRREGSIDIVQSEQVVVDALRPLDEPQYAEPDTGD